MERRGKGKEKEGKEEKKGRREKEKREERERRKKGNKREEKDTPCARKHALGADAPP